MKKTAHTLTSVTYSPLQDIINSMKNEYMVVEYSHYYRGLCALAKKMKKIIIIGALLLAPPTQLELDSLLKTRV